MTETAGQNTAENYPLWQRAAGLAAAALLLCGLVCFSARAAHAALVLPGASWRLRAPLFAISALLAILALFLAVPPLYWKWESGHFLVTRAERAAGRAAWTRRNLL